MFRASIPTFEEHQSVETVLLTLGGFSKFQLWACFSILSPEVGAAAIAMIPVFIGRDPHSNSVDGWVNKNQTWWSTNSVVEEWGLHGEFAWMNDMLTSVFMGGMMFGAFSASQMSDRFGRKKIHFLLVLLMTVFGSACAFAPNPYLYAALRFVAGIGVGGYYCIYSIYLMEFLTPSWRVICGSISFWFLGEMILALSAYFIHSWRLLSLLITLPSALMLFTFPFIPETPRWLLCHSKGSQAAKVFGTIAKWNGTQKPSELVIDSLKKAVEGEQAASSADGSKNSLMLLWSNSKLRRELITFIFLFFSLAFTYYGISFNVKNLSGDPYLNMFYMGLVDAFAFPAGSVFSNPLGRRLVTSLFLTFGAITLSGLIIIESWTGGLLLDHEFWITLFSFLARFGVAGAWGVVTCFASECFPTIARSTGLGLCCLAANLGGVLAPQIAFAGTLWPAAPHFVFCVIIVISALASWTLPEMSGKPLQNF